ncbi:helix-turn-helix domain-containing protein [Pyruvatibacter mobilis]|uniref:helix-turn-helix domain-containing protein n=1 Tax=Pyruvatibacter mobilis TaxID=1712261 RepID=UPI003BAD9863
MHASEWQNGNFPQRLKRARRSSGLTQMELADRLGTRQFTVSRIEGGRKPRDPLLSRVVAFIGNAERSSPEIQDKLVSAIARSDELKALIARIAAEL